jgi:hypothetical protein
MPTTTSANMHASQVGNRALISLVKPNGSKAARVMP